MLRIFFFFLIISSQLLVFKEIKIQVRGFAPIEMLEFWNIGIMGLENQTE